MKKILEYKVYDLLKDKDNEKFLDKVKKENPDLYGHFLSILGNKGLEIAKQKYQEYDPEYIAIQKQKEKEEKLKRKRQSTKEFKKEYDKNLLNELKPKIEEVENVLSNTNLTIFKTAIIKDDRIIEYLESCKYKIDYNNNFKQQLKKPNDLKYSLRYDIHIDTINFIKDFYSYIENDVEIKKIIQIKQYYDILSKRSTYSIHYDLFDADYDDFLPKIDIDKNHDFLRQRNDEARKLNKNREGISEILDSLKKFSVILDERIYEKWYKEWEIRNNANKYNL